MKTHVVRSSMAATALPSALLLSAVLPAVLPTVALAAPANVTGSAALALAAVIAPYSSDIDANGKTTIAHLFDGNTRVATAKTQLSVVAESVTCRTSNVDITARSCDMTFKSGKRSVKGRAANEITATMAAAGIEAEGAAGSMIAGITKLECTLDPNEIAQKAGGGAACAFEAGQ